MKPKFEPMEYVCMTLWGVALFIWLAAAIFSIVDQEGSKIIFLRFFVVFLHLIVILNYWLACHERAIRKELEKGLVDKLEDL